MPTRSPRCTPSASGTPPVTRHALCALALCWALAPAASPAQGSRTPGQTGRPAPVTGQVEVERVASPAASLSGAREVPAPKDWQDLPPSAAAPAPLASSRDTRGLMPASTTAATPPTTTSTTPTAAGLAPAAAPAQPAAPEAMPATRRQRAPVATGADAVAPVKPGRHAQAAVNAAATGKSKHPGKAGHAMPATAHAAKPSSASASSHAKAGQGASPGKHRKASQAASPTKPAVAARHKPAVAEAKMGVPHAASASHGKNGAKDTTRKAGPHAAKAAHAAAAPSVRKQHGKAAAQAQHQAGHTAEHAPMSKAPRSPSHAKAHPKAAPAHPATVTPSPKPVHRAATT